MVDPTPTTPPRVDPPGNDPTTLANIDETFEDEPSSSHSRNKISVVTTEDTSQPKRQHLPPTGSSEVYYDVDMNEYRHSDGSAKAAAAPLTGLRRFSLYRIILAGFLAGFLATVVILIVFFVVVEKDTNSTASSSALDDDATAGTDVAVLYLNPLPDNMAELCEADKMANAVQRQACQDICDQAACCKLSYLDPQSCWKDNAPLCHDYHEPCLVLEDSKEIPSELPLGHSFATDTKVYHNSTYYGREYYEKYLKDATVFPNAAVLWNQPQILPPAPDALVELCKAAQVFGDDALNSEEATGAALTCHEVCNTAKCCWDTGLNHDNNINDGIGYAVDRCWTHPNCWAYTEACSILLLTREELQGVQLDADRLTPAQENIADYCHPDKIQTDLDELLLCQELCMPAECCWNSGLLDQCSSTSLGNHNDGRCEGYAYTCSVLNVPFDPTAGTSSGTSSSSYYWDSVSKPDQTSTTTTTTSPNQGGTTISGEVIVHSNNDTSAVATTTNSGNESHIVISNSMIQDACWNHDNSINIHNGRATLCEQVCAPGSCCFDEQQKCPGAPYLPADFCDKYAPCEIIYKGSSADIAARVETACSNLNDLSGCVEVCAAGTCCFTSNPWHACAATNQDVHCSDYTDCQVLYEGTSAQETQQTSTTQGTSRNSD